MSRISRDIEGALGLTAAAGTSRKENFPPVLGPAAWLPVVVLPVFVVLGRSAQPAWLFMWVLALALFLGCKWLTWCRFALANGGCGLALSLGYLCGWVGMSPERFFTAAARPPSRAEWASALLKTIFGAAVVWIVTPLVAGERMAPWTGMVGLVFVLHFGTFHLLSLTWRARGCDAEPLMRAPVLAKSLGEFWNARWNTGFHTLAKEFVFAPVARRCGARVGMLATFFVSGLIHELVISFPAGGGFGLPTLYFVLQGAGVLIERSKLARAVRLAAGMRGRLFMLAMTAGPVTLLFHKPFRERVMLPFLEAIGAL